MKKNLMILTVVLFVYVGSTQAVTIDWVHVGNPGNAGDTEVMYDGTSGYGSVGYEYQIGKYEVTAGQYTEFLNAVAATDTHGLYKAGMWSWNGGCKIQQSGNSGSFTYSVAPDLTNRPVNAVTWYSALRFSNWLHNGQPTGMQNNSTTENGAYDISLGVSVARKTGAQVWLPSEDEWYKAAYHKNDGITGNYFDYPTSSDSSSGYVNTSGNLSGTGTPFDEGGTDPGNYATYNGDGLNIDNWTPYYRTKVGEWENSDSPYGTFDMGGNVQEWNETLLIYGQYYSNVFRGGSYNSGTDYNDAREIGSSYRSTDFIRYGDTIGFRVASVPEPCSVVLVVLGGLAVIRRRL